MIKELIIEYLNDNPDSGYFKLSKVFGLPIVDILEHIEIGKDNLRITPSGINILDDKGRLIYHESPNGMWRGYLFRGKGECIIKRRSFE